MRRLPMPVDEAVSPERIKPHPRNPRKGHIAAITEMKGDGEPDEYGPDDLEAVVAKMYRTTVDRFFRQVYRSTRAARYARFGVASSVRRSRKATASP